MIFLNLRGCSGSGKTTAALRLMTGLTPTELTDPLAMTSWPTPHGQLRGSNPYSANASLATHDGVTFYSVGCYPPPREKGDAQCGGMDKIRTFDEACAQIKWAALNLVGHVDVVLLESAVSSTTYERWATLDDYLYEQGHQYLWCFLNTPAPKCIDRILQRTQGYNPPNKKNINRLHKAVLSTRRKAIADNRYVYDIPHTNPLTSLDCILSGRGSRYEPKGHGGVEG